MLSTHLKFSSDNILNIYYKFAFLFFLTIWIMGIFIEYLIPHFESLAFLYPILKSTYSTVCHQQQDILLIINNSATLTCSRCTGIYIGSFFSALILLFFSVSKIKNGKILILAFLPMLIDVVCYSLGVYTYSKTIALFSGILFGSVGIIYIYNGFDILFNELKEK